MSYVLLLNYSLYGRIETIPFGVFSELDLAQEVVEDLIPVKWHWSEKWHSSGSEPTVWETMHNGFGPYIRWEIHWFGQDIVSELPQTLVVQLEPENYAEYQDE